MAWIKEIVMAGIITVIACAGIFELLERRKRAAFKEQIHDLAQKYIDKMKQEEHVKECASGHGQTYPPTMRLVYLGGGRPATARPGPCLLGAERIQRGGPHGWRLPVRCRLFIWYGQCRRRCIPFRPVLTPGRTAKDRTSTHQRKDYDMNDEKKIGFSVELENNHVDLWAHGDDETLVNLAVAATANIVAAACGNDVKEAEKLLQDVKIGLDAALDQALEHPTQEINPEDFKAIGPADLPAKPLDKD